MADSKTKAPKSRAGTGAKIKSSIMKSVKFEVEAVVGEARLTLAEVEDLDAGSIVALDTGLNGSVSLRLNDVEIARGELVSVDDKFAIKITDVAD